MLEFSNSQSCKEFTLEGEFYRRHTVVLPSSDSTADAGSLNYIDEYRCIADHANCFTLQRSKPNP
jgi:hypothetical protein